MQNRSPQQIAAELLSQGQASLSKIAIQPKGNHERGYAREVISIKQDKQEQQWEIAVRWESIEDKLQLAFNEIIALFPHEKNPERLDRMAQEMSDCWMAIDEELARPRIQLTATERDLQLGLSGIEKEYWNLSPFLTEKQQAIFCYFLPFAQRIKEDTSEMAHCLSTFLGKRVEVERVPKILAAQTDYPGKPLYQWRIGLNSKVGGKGVPKNDELILRILCTEEDLNNLLPGRSQRKILEQVVLPAFIHHDMAWKIELKLEDEKPFLIEEKNEIRVGFFKISA